MNVKVNDTTGYLFDVNLKYNFDNKQSMSYKQVLLLGDYPGVGNLPFIHTYYIKIIIIFRALTS
mgnify:CR=1 FL=1